MFTAAEVSGVLEGHSQMSHPEARINAISTDSRQIAHGGEVCFIALKGLRSDGHQFLKQVWEAGVRNFIVRDDTSLPDLPESNVFHVSDTVQALQTLAAMHRAQFDLPCIGITGSNGKTWVKEWLYQLLSPEHFIVKSPRSYNSQIGVPLSVLQIRKEHTLGVFEAGISVRGEMVRLAEIIRPDIGIFTHLGDAHQAGFDTAEEKLIEKLQLFSSAKLVLCCSDEQWIHECIRITCPNAQLLSWNSTGGEADLRVEDIMISGGCARINYIWQSERGTYQIPFDDQASVRNGITCCLLLLQLGYPGDVIATRMAGLHPIALRLAIHHLPGNGVLVNDAYSLDMGSLSVALETLRQHSSGMPRIVIVSDIDRQHAGSYQVMAELFAKYEVDHVLAIGKEIAELGPLLRGQTTFRAFPDMQRFIVEKPWHELMPGAFLLKGARAFHFERLAEQMQGRYHSAVLEIDLNALLSNLQFFISRLHPDTKIIAMVKAAAYGSGGAEIARFLAFHNVSMLAVAYLDEGIDLRTSGVKTPILVMNPDPARVDQLFAHDLEPEVYDFAMLEAIAQYNAARPEIQCRVHIKVDTGMHRLGFRTEHTASLIDWLKTHNQVRVASVFSHLASAADQDAREFTLHQIKSFATFYTQLSDGIGYQPMRHILNTGGAVYYPEYQYEAVRLGIGLYGAGMPEMRGQLLPVHTLKARVSQVHEIVRGDSVGYDRAFVATQNMRIGTINVGYADGLRRCAGNQKYAVIIQDKPASILGKVCMDMAMVDLSAHPDVQSGDEVIIFGQQHPIDDLANICDTNAYEILTGISQRVARVFLYS